MTAGSPGAGLQVLDVDNMIARLLEAGYSGKVTKSPPLKNAEIASVCAAAREVFLSQPTLIELSPPVKIVGDVHGQVCRISIFVSLSRHDADDFSMPT
jgi:serine/threonine-protein phosphatase PP1 catalytic subunit